MTDGTRIGIDLGGTKIEGLVLDNEGRELARLRIPSPQGNYHRTVDALAGLVRDLENEAGVRVSQIGVGIPGAISLATGRIKNANSTWIIGEALDQDLKARLGRPVKLANDANCFAVSEATDGAAAGADVVFGVILGTGVGGGLVVSQHSLTGVNAIAGEWGHNPLPWPEDTERPGPPCYCGLTGCIETFLSGPGLSRDYGQPDTPVEDIARRAHAGEADAEAALVRYESRLARALAHVINIVDPDVIVLGGGVSNLSRLYEAVPPLLIQWVFSDTVTTRIVQNKHGDSSGVRGAAWL